MTCEVLAHLVNPLAADEKYPVLNKNKLKIPIQMTLSQKKKTFSRVFSEFLKSRLNFGHFEKKMALIDFVFPKLRSLKTWLGKCLKSNVSEDTLKSNMVN